MTEIRFARYGEIPPGSTIPGFVNFLNIVAPLAPVAGFTSVYVDSTQKVLSAINDAGQVSITVVPSTAPANKFATGISAAGVIAYTQPAFSNLSGTAAPSQGGTGVANNDLSTITISGSFGTTFTITGTTSVTLPTSGTLASLGASGNGAALTKTDDTNVTMTLGGTPSKALLTASSLTLGWTGSLAVGRGGTGQTTLTLNGVVVGNGTNAVNITSAGTNGQILVGSTGIAPLFVTLGTDATITNAGALTISNNAVTNAKLAQAAAMTLKGNPSGVLANLTDFTIDSLTVKASPVGADELLIWDVAGVAMKKATITATVGAVGVSSVGGLTGGVLTGQGLATAGGAGGTLSVDASYLRGMISGLQISAPGGGNILTITAGVSTSDDFTTLMKTTSTYTKTTSSWAVGSGNGMLDGGAATANTWYHIYQIERTDTSVVDFLMSLAPGTSSPVTVTSATPGVTTWSNGSHGLSAGAPIVYSGSVAPTGITFGTVYYVSTTSLAATSFVVSDTQAHALAGTNNIATSSTGTAVVATSAPVLPASYSVKRRIASIKLDATPNITKVSQAGNEFLWGVPFPEFTVTNVGTSAQTQAMTTPPGVKTIWYGAVELILGASSANVSLYLSALDQTSVAAVAAFANMAISITAGGIAGSTNVVSQEVRIRTDTASTIRWISTATDAATITRMLTKGYYDNRGQDY